MSEEEKSYELKRMHDRNLYLNKQLQQKDKELEATTYPKKMTKENIEEELGYKIDIID